MERCISTVLLAKGMVGLGGVALAFGGWSTNSDLLTVITAFF
jgi:hypothetical protein